MPHYLHTGFGFGLGDTNLLSRRQGGGGYEAIESGTLISDFETVSDWNVFGTGATSAADTDSKQAGAQSLRVTTGASGPNAQMDNSPSFVWGNDSTLLFWVDYLGPNRVSSLNVFLSEDGTFGKYWLATVTVSGRLRGPQMVALSAADFTANGGIVAGATITRIRIRQNAPVAASVRYDSLYRNRQLVTPKFIVGFDDISDDHYDEAFAYMQPLSIPGTLYAISGQVGDASAMSLAELQEVYAAGWDIGNHSADHLNLNDHDTTAVCASQTPGPAMVINGSEASGGVATFDASRHVVIHATGNQFGKSAAIDGTLDGEPVNETVFLRASSGVPTLSLFDTVTAITCDVTSAITVGTAYSYAETYAHLNDCSQYLIANGMPRAALHHAYPFGAVNETVLLALSDLGFKTARVVGGEPVPTALGLYGHYGVQALVPGPSTSLATMTEFVDEAIARGATGHICFHTLPETASTGSDVSLANFKAFIDYLADKRDAGLVEPATISRWYDRVRKP